MTAVAPKPISTRPYPARRVVKGSRLAHMLRTTDPKDIAGVLGRAARSLSLQAREQRCWFHYADVRIMPTSVPSVLVSRGHPAQPGRHNPGTVRLFSPRQWRRSASRTVGRGERHDRSIVDSAHPDLPAHRPGLEEQHGSGLPRESASAQPPLSRTAAARPAPRIPRSAGIMPIDSRPGSALTSTKLRQRRHNPEVGILRRPPPRVHRTEGRSRGNQDPSCGVPAGGTQAGTVAGEDPDHPRPDRRRHSSATRSPFSTPTTRSPARAALQRRRRLARAPRRITAKCGPYLKLGKPERRNQLVNEDDHTIVRT